MKIVLLFSIFCIAAVVAHQPFGRFGDEEVVDKEFGRFGDAEVDEEIENAMQEVSAQPYGFIPGPFTMCKAGAKYVINFCYTLTKEQLTNLADFIQTEIDLAGRRKKRSTNALRTRRGIKNMAFDFVVERAGDAACFYIYKWFASYAAAKVKGAMIEFVKDSIAGMIG